VCRKYYIHPALLEAYLEGAVLPPLPPRHWSKRKSHGPTLRQQEMDVLAFLRGRLNVPRAQPDAAAGKRRSAASRHRRRTKNLVRTAVDSSDQQTDQSPETTQLRQTVS
jgi:DNA topoisomerase-1